MRRSSTWAASAIRPSARPGRSAACRRRALRARLLVETHVREDHIHLYGFIDDAERDWFPLALRASAHWPSHSYRPCRGEAGARDFGSGQAGPGASRGGRAAARRSYNQRVAGQDRQGRSPDDGWVGGAALEAANGQGASADAIAALENLGVGRSEALGAIAAAARRLGSEAGADVLINAGLEELAR